VLAENYEYVSGDGSNPICTLRSKPKVGGIRGHVDIKDNDMQAHMEAINVAPLSVSVDASNWHAYHSGVLSFEDCGATLNHAVLLVGYGKEEETGEEYWLIRNSWGADWGLDGSK
jgi:C1A family cysteine protease